MIVRLGEIYFIGLMLLSYATQNGTQKTYLALSLILLSFMFLRGMIGDFSKKFQKVYLGFVIWYLLSSLIDMDIQWRHDIRWLSEWFGLTVKRAEFVSGRPSSTGLTGLLLLVIGLHGRKWLFIFIGTIIIFWADSRSAMVALFIYWALMESKNSVKLILSVGFLAPLIATIGNGYDDRTFLYLELISEIMIGNSSFDQKFSHAHNLVLEGFLRGYFVGFILLIINFHFFKMSLRRVDDSKIQYHLKICIAYLIFNFFQSGWLVEGFNINSIFVLHSMASIFYKKRQKGLHVQKYQENIMP